MRSTRELLLLVLAPTLLCLTAGTQRYLAATHNLSPWRGGGYGMFADLHLEKHRFVAVFIVDADGNPHLVQTPRAFAEQSRQITIMASQGRVRRMAEELAAAQWVMVRGVSSGTPFLAGEAPPGSETRPLIVAGVIVRVFQYDFDATNTQLQRKILIEENTLQTGG